MPDWIDPKTGLVRLTDEEKAKKGLIFNIGKVVIPCLLVSISVGIGFAIHEWFDTALYESRIALLKEYDMQWACLGAVIFYCTVIWLNIYVIDRKAKYSHGEKNLSPNFFIYSFANQNSFESSAVILNEEGDIGKYNRGNRSIQYFIETNLSILVLLPITAFVYPTPSLVGFIIYCLGRIVYQIGYANFGFGGHFPGFGLDRTSSAIFIGLTIVATYKGFQ